MDNLTEQHIFVRGNMLLPPLVLLHGTGGDERDLMEIGRFFGHENPILSIRGRVDEGGYARYFERFGMGEFNLESLHEETAWLVDQVQALLKHYGAREDAIVIGYSNGANIASHAFLTRPDLAWQGGIFLHPMTIELIDHPVQMSDKWFIMSYGFHDPIVTEEDFDQLMNNFRMTDATLRTVDVHAGHELGMEELIAASNVANELGKLDGGVPEK
ncbi:alpha/beta hydrolase [Periweissella cryptocerci]|uniref:Alpha/beta hydrolase n=1 Tax=Periweissella cryptocerci TaxID=2506420 RepID=A0A4P6YTP9_9LACO|nr:alpha/beta hydrolase [Periweissella cryptocerci]QBO36071.1 alpha/beta hydrolase [Periweissella cryptocerci]